MNEQELLLDCLRRLNTQRVAYMLAGSMASNAWGIPRSTHGLDFVVQLPPSEVSAFVAAFAYPDYYLDEASVRAAYQSPFQFNLNMSPPLCARSLLSEKYSAGEFKTRGLASRLVSHG